MKKSEPPVVVEQILNTPLEVVWQAITNINEMRKWYFEILPDFKPEKGFKKQFTLTNESRTFTHLWEITEVIPLKKIANSWKFSEYPGEGLVIFELSKVNDSTILTLTNLVLEEFPDEIPEFRRESCLNGWQFFIQGRLKEYCESYQSEGKNEHKG